MAEGNLAVGLTGSKLDTTTLNQTDGTEVHREAVVVTDPDTLAARAEVTKSFHPGGYALATIPKVPLDAFHRLRVSNPTTLFDSQLQYDEQDLFWNEKLTGSGTFSHDANGGFGELDVTTASGDQVIRQSPYQRYQPGKSQLVIVTVDFVEAVTNCRKCVGYFDANNGVFLEMDGSDISIVLRSSVSGSVVNTRVAQADWNGDKHDGTGNSGLTLDMTKSQIFFMDFEWLGVGSVRAGFFHNGDPHIAHEFHHSNLNNKTYMTTANLPIRYEITNDAAISGATKMRQICGTVISEGGFSSEAGYEFVAGNGATSIAVTTRRAIVSIRPKTTFNSITNRAMIRPDDFGFFPQTNAGFMEIVYNGTLGGTPSWTSVDANSVCEFDIAGTTVTGGITLAHAHADAGGLGSKAFSGMASGSLASRFPLHLDIDGANPTIMSLVVTSMNATCDAVGHIGWREIR
jgi:hypothetical protein